MFKRNKYYLLLVAFTMIMSIFIISFNNVIAIETDELTEVTKALQWIKDQQDEDGFWDEENYGVYGEAYQLYTTKVVEIIGKNNYLLENYTKGVEALKSINPVNNDYLSRYLSIGELKEYYDIKSLIKGQNLDGGWGLISEYSSNIVDTMLAVKAISSSEHYSSTTMNRGIYYLIKNQNLDGSWSYTESSKPNIALTAEITLILSKFIGNTGLTSEHLEISIRKSGEYLLSLRRSDNTWGTDKENINGTLLALKAVSLSMRQPIGENIYENIKELQMENGSWYNDTYTTALALSLFKEKDKEIENGINEKIKDIKAYKYEDNEKIETYSFNPYETAIFEIEGEFEKDDTDITLLLKKPSGTIITAAGEEGYSWNIENDVDGAYILIANLKDLSTGKLIETFEKDIIIEKQFKISSVISKLYPKEIATNTKGIAIINTSLINESNTNGEAQIKFTVIDSNQKIILNKTLNQYCEKENQIINIFSL